MKIARNNLKNLLRALYCNNSPIQEFCLVHSTKTTLANLERRGEISCDLEDFLHGELHNARFFPLYYVV